jgi:hypothetical protein
MSVIYTGIFFNESEFININLPPIELDKSIEYKHLTIKFKPSDNEFKLFNQSIGTTVFLRVVGYYKNENNYTVQVAPLNPYLYEDRYDTGMYIELYASNAENLNDNSHLIFKTLQNSFIIKGTLGYFDGANVIIGEEYL